MKGEVIDNQLETPPILKNGKDMILFVKNARILKKRGDFQRREEVSCQDTNEYAVRIDFVRLAGYNPSKIWINSEFDSEFGRLFYTPELLL